MHAVEFLDGRYVCNMMFVCVCVNCSTISHCAIYCTVTLNGMIVRSFLIQSEQPLQSTNKLLLLLHVACCMHDC